jgi:hypothetical protein
MKKGTRFELLSDLEDGSLEKGDIVSLYEDVPDFWNEEVSLYEFQYPFEKSKSVYYISKSILKKVNQEFKPGDKVLLWRNHQTSDLHWPKDLDSLLGKTVTIKEVNYFKKNIYNIEESGYFISEEWVDPLETTVTAVENGLTQSDKLSNNMDSIKVGDKFRVIKFDDTYSTIEVGHILELVFNDNSRCPRFKHEKNGSSVNVWFYLENLQKISDFEVGDKVKIVSREYNKIGWVTPMEILFGKISTITIIEGDTVKLAGCPKDFWYDKTWLELVSKASEKIINNNLNNNNNKDERNNISTVDLYSTFEFEPRTGEEYSASESCKLHFSEIWLYN